MVRLALVVFAWLVRHVGGEPDRGLWGVTVLWVCWRADWKGAAGEARMMAEGRGRGQGEIEEEAAGRRRPPGLLVWTASSPCVSL